MTSAKPPIDPIQFFQIPDEMSASGYNLMEFELVP